MKSLFSKEIHNDFLLGGTFFWGLCLVFKKKERKGEKENQSSFSFLQNYKLGPVWKYEHSIKWIWILCFGNKNKVNHMESHMQPVQLGSIWMELRRPHVHPGMLGGAVAGLPRSCHLQSLTVGISEVAAWPRLGFPIAELHPCQIGLWNVYKQF